MRLARMDGQSSELVEAELTISEAPSFSHLSIQDLTDMAIRCPALAYFASDAAHFASTAAHLSSKKALLDLPMET